MRAANGLVDVFDRGSPSTPEPFFGNSDVAPGRQLPKATRNLRQLTTKFLDKLRGT